MIFACFLRKIIGGKGNCWVEGTLSLNQTYRMRASPVFLSLLMLLMPITKIKPLT